MSLDNALTKGQTLALRGLVRVLPFPKRKKTDEMELGDDDIVVLEEEAIEIDIDDLEVMPPASQRHRLPRVSAPPRAPRESLRRLVTPRPGLFEDDVADECLKSIAAATSRSPLRDSFPESIVPLLPPSPRLPSFDDADETTRRPALSSSSSLPVARDSVPGVLAVTSSASVPVFARTSLDSFPSVSSVAPVSMSSTPGPVEPTVVLVRQPPRTGWVVAAAFLGAATALFGMHLLSRSADPAPAPAAAAVTAPPAANTAVVPPAPASPPATVRFNDDQGVAVIAAPAAAPAPTNAKPVLATAALKSAPAPVKSAAPAKTASLGPKLPDGSMALGARAPEPTKSTTAAPAPQPEPAAPSSPKKKLSPEQELAEAQLKASMR